MSGERLDRGPGLPFGPLVRAALALVPVRWREAVVRDLADEARGMRRGLARECWMAWHALRIGARFAQESRHRARTMATTGTMAWNLGTDIRLAWRSLRREPASALAVVCTLALGTGAATATYAVVNHAMLRPVPGVADEASLVSVYTQVDPSTPHRGAVSHAHLETMRSRTTALSGLAAWRLGDFPFAIDSSQPPTTKSLVTVTLGFFDVLGVQPRVGRFFSADEYEDTGLNVMVISERTWRREFSRDPSIVGRRVLVSGHSFEIIGVARAYQGIDRLDHDDGWLPYASERTFDASEVGSRNSEHVNMVGRLAPGASLAVVQEQLTAAFRSAGEQRIGTQTFWPFAFAGLSDGVGVTRGRILAIFRVMLAGVALLVVLACANAANLMLARHLRRRPDLSLRHALGAGRARLLRELLVEAAGLAIGAGVLGLALAAALTTMFRTSRLLSYLPALDDLSLDWRVATFCGVVSGATIVLFALVPAILASRADIRAGMDAGGRTTRRTAWLRTALVSAQVALSFALVVTAALLSQSVRRLQSVDFGLSPDAVLAFSFRPTRAGFDDARTATAMQDVHDRLAAAPGIAGVALSFMSPFDGPSGSTLRLPGQDDAHASRLRSHYVTSAYFAVLDIPLLQGRTFTPGEGMARRADGSPIILNQALAAQLFGPAPAIGQVVHTRRATRGPWQTRPVIGIVGNTIGSDVREGQLALAYEPFGGSRIATVLVRPAVPLNRAADLVRQSARDAAPAVPVDDIAPLRVRADEEIAQERVLTRLSLVIGAVAALLALGGLYAAVAHSVGERMREFAIRIAIGATRTIIAGAILRHVLRVAVIGLVAGGLLVASATGLIAAYLYGVSSRDPLTLAAAAAGLTAAALAAVWPAVRLATRVDPATALR
jgi:putative ABC transport system permease protein